MKQKYSAIILPITAQANHQETHSSNSYIVIPLQTHSRNIFQIVAGPTNFSISSSRSTQRIPSIVVLNDDENGIVMIMTTKSEEKKIIMNEKTEILKT